MRLQCISACGMPRALDMRLGYMTCTQLDTTTSSLPKANVQQDLLAPSDPDTSNCSIRLLQFNDHMHGIRKTCKDDFFSSGYATHCRWINSIEIQ